MEEIRKENIMSPKVSGKKLVVFIFLDHYIRLTKTYTIMRDRERVYLNLSI